MIKKIIIITVIIITMYIIEREINKKIEGFENPEKLKIYFINLDRSKDRLEQMIKQCSNLRCIRIEAIDGKNFEENYEDELEYKVKNKKLRKNDIACFLSHVKCLKEIIDNNITYGIVLEDDVILPNNFMERLKEIKDELPENYDILYLGGTRICGEKYTKNLLKQKQINKNCNAGAFSYIISTKCAKKIIKRINEDGIYKMYDHQLREYFPELDVYYINPPLIDHDFEIESARIERKYNEKYINRSKEVITE